ncbi:hypothetical protein [Rhodoblastus sp.]|jgi:hypothetical protein|uniref:hypothetical protein n=1 Tax=Rhodoblastus sp. TaxID=1962975 RepID=UPI0025FE054F|nr:hypothetical protein [Rhodoblastus sp.]
MSVLFGQDLQLWQERKRNDSVRKALVELRELNPSSDRDPDAFDITHYAVNSLRDPQSGHVLFTDASQVSLSTHMPLQYWIGHGDMACSPESEPSAPIARAGCVVGGDASVAIGC